ncbi:unnamed protein product, partial [Coregonus sp. 'balchen']
MMKKGRRFNCVCFRGKAENPSQTREMKDGLSTKDTNRLVTAREMAKSDLETEYKLSKEKEKDDKRTRCVVVAYWLSHLAALSHPQQTQAAQGHLLIRGHTVPDSSDLTNGSPWNTDSSNDGQPNKPIGLVDVPLSQHAEERWEEDEEMVPCPVPGVQLSDCYLSGGVSQLFLAQWGRDMMLRRGERVRDSRKVQGKVEH